MSVREKVAELQERLATERQFPTQGETLFLDLETQQISRGFIPRAVAEKLLGGRGVNMYLLHNLLDEALSPQHPNIPLIFGTGLLTSYLPSAARGNVSSWSPESGVLMDSNAGDFFPSFMKWNGIDHIVLYGRCPRWQYIRIRGGELSFHDAGELMGLDNIDLRQRTDALVGGAEGGAYGMASVTVAGENQVLCAGIMAGPKAIYARGGPGAKMGSLQLKAILIEGKLDDRSTARPHKHVNRAIAKKLLDTSVVKNALKTRGTPFLYKPSRMISAIGTKNNQVTTWTPDLDAENIDPYRPGMVGCMACPVNCRPLNDMTGVEGVKQDKYAKGDGPEYVTLGKFGPNIGITSVKAVLRLNNICNDLGLDTASSGTAIAWAMELYQRGLIDKGTVGYELEWGDVDAVERLLFQTSRREGFGNVIADSTRAVERGHYPPEAANYLMAVKGLAQSDPHDARILKAFALGLAVATRGMDHLRNRVTLEINAKINDDPNFKRDLYGGEVSAEPTSYVGKEIAVRKCEDVYAAGDSVGMCRFTTKLFNSPSLPGPEHFSSQIGNVTGIEMSPQEVEFAGRRVMGIERMINARFGVTAADDTLPNRWFEEPIATGPFKGELIDRGKFEALKQRFYAISGLGSDGLPASEFLEDLEATLAERA